MYYSQESNKNKPQGNLTNENMYSQKLKSPSGPVFFEISPVKTYLDSLAPGSKRTIEGALARISGLVICLRNGHNLESQDICNCVLDRNGNQVAEPAIFPWHTLQRQEISYVKATLTERYAPSTANKMLAALRGILQECWRFELLNTDQYHRLTDVKSVKGSSLLAGRALSIGEIVNLFDVCISDSRPQGTRDAAIFALLIGCGLRRAELVALDMKHLTEGNHLLIIQGKGDKKRKVPVEGGAYAALTDWLQLRDELITISNYQAIFIRIDKSGKIKLTRLTSQGVYDILYRRALQARLDSVTPHDCRRTYISSLLDQHDIAIVAKLAGHSNIQTTARYDRRPAEAARRAAQSIHIPYTRRKNK